MAIGAAGAAGFLSPVSVFGLDSTGSVSGGASGGFGQVLKNVIDQNTQANQAAESAVQALVTGQSQDVHSVAMAVTQADLSFRLILELRNRMTEAYQEISRMQV